MIPAFGHDPPHRHPRLEPDRIIATMRRLRDRIGERFPGSGLLALSEGLLTIADECVERLKEVAQPSIPIRTAVGLLLAALVALLGRIAAGVPLHLMVSDFGAFLQVLDAAKNVVLFLGAGIFFLATLEGRIKRRRALRYIRELRAVAHMVDMHQLNKDPDRLVQDPQDTPSSPQRGLTRYEMSRYLDYCSELLSLNSKVAALYAQQFNDPVVLAAVDEVEDLTTGLSAKIWQKMVVLNQAIR
jgi:hypothetical protein